MHTYSETTHEILVQVEPRYAPEHSSPEDSRYLFVYRVTIENQGHEPVQLLHRQWIITDGKGRVEEVTGPGVVGKQPMLKPGESFTYESFCPLTTPTGNMRGQYQMVTSKGTVFDVAIPLFFLRDVSILH